MSAEKKYKSLLIDTISYLQNLESSNFESANVFYRGLENNTKKSSPLKKYSPNKITKQINECSPKPLNYSISNKKTVSQDPPLQENSVKSNLSLDSINKHIQEEQKTIKSQNESNSIENSKLKLFSEKILSNQTYDGGFLNQQTKSSNNLEIITEKNKPAIVHNSDIAKLNNPQSPALESKKIFRETKPPVIEDNFNDIKNILKNVSSNLILTDEILDDKLAKQKAQKYIFKNISSPITILAYKENEEYYKFLEKLCIALNIYFMPAKVVSAYMIEKQNNWEAFFTDNEINLIISLDYTIFELPLLRSHYKENPSKQEKYLKNIPLFLLPDLSIYFKEPSLKLSLFKAIEKKITEIKQ